MKIKTLLRGGKFSQYQHMVVMRRQDDPLGLVAVGGGYPPDIKRRFGDEKIKHISVYENFVRIEIV